MKIYIRRQWNDYRIAETDFDNLESLHWDNLSGGVSLSGIGLAIMILGIKKESKLKNFQNFIVKPFLKIRKQDIIEFGVILGMIGVILVSSLWTIDQKWDYVPRLGHNLCGENIPDDNRL